MSLCLSVCERKRKRKKKRSDACSRDHVPFLKHFEETFRNFSSPVDALQYLQNLLISIYVLT